MELNVQLIAIFSAVINDFNKCQVDANKCQQKKQQICYRLKEQGQQLKGAFYSLCFLTNLWNVADIQTDELLEDFIIIQFICNNI